MTGVQTCALPISLNNKENQIEIINKSEYIVEIENMFFNFDSPSMQIKKNSNLDSLAVYLKRNPNSRIAVIGYTDALGTASYNDKLSEKRAKIGRAHV